MHVRAMVRRGFVLGVGLVLAGTAGIAAAQVSQSDNNKMTEPTQPPEARPPAGESTLAVPTTMGYQGFLTDNGGTPINGNVSLDLALYPVQTGGSALWNETQSPVSVQDGVFSIGLGDVTPLPTSIFNGGTPLWLGISVNGEAELPRSQLRTSPYAYNAQLLDGLPASGYVHRAGDSMVGPLGLDGGVIGQQTGGVTEVVDSTTDVLLRSFYLDQQTGTGSWSGRAGRVIISANGQGTPGPSGGGSGTATVSQGGSTIATIAIPGPGARPWTYIVEIPDLGAAPEVDVAVRADASTAPVLVRSIILETDNSGAAGAGNTLDQAYDQGGLGAGRVITADAGAVSIQGPSGLKVFGPVALGDTLTDGSLRLAAAGNTNSLLMDNFGSGAEVVMQDQNNGYTHFLQPDVNGSGGYLEVTRSAATYGFYVDGNFGGTNEPYVSISGSTQGASFDMSSSGDASVNLPADAISSTEMLNEPGISQGKVDGDVTVTGAASMIDVVTTTITIPSDGYIVLTASGQARFSGSTTGNSMDIQIDETAGGVLDSNHYYTAGWSSASPNGTTWEPVQTQRTYFKSAGTYTFRLEAMDNDLVGNKALWNPVITARFFPTGYGTVQERPAGPELGQFSDVSYRDTGTNGPGTVSESAPLVDLRELEIRTLQAEQEATQLRQQLAQAQLAAQHAGQSK